MSDTGTKVKVYEAQELVAERIVKTLNDVAAAVDAAEEHILYLKEVDVLHTRPLTSAALEVLALCEQALIVAQNISARFPERSVGAEVALKTARTHLENLTAVVEELQPPVTAQTAA